MLNTVHEGSIPLVQVSPEATRTTVVICSVRKETKNLSTRHNKLTSSAVPTPSSTSTARRIERNKGPNYGSHPQESALPTCSSGKSLELSKERKNGAQSVRQAKPPSWASHCATIKTKRNSPNSQTAARGHLFALGARSVGLSLRPAD